MDAFRDTRLKVTAATDCNQHTTAIKHIAQHVNDLRLVQCCEAVETLHNFYGHMPPALAQIRDELRDRALARLSPRDAESLNNSM